MAIANQQPEGYDSVAWLTAKRCHILTYAQCGLATAQHHACLVGGVDYATFEQSLQRIHTHREAGTFWPKVNLTVTPVIFHEDPIRVEGDVYTFRLPVWSFGVERGDRHWEIPGGRTTDWTRAEVVKVARDCIEANEKYVKSEVVECGLCDAFFQVLLEEYRAVPSPVAKVVFRA